MTCPELRQPQRIEDLEELFKLSEGDLELLKDAYFGPQKLGMAVVLLCHRRLGFVPPKGSIPEWLISWVAGIVGVSAVEWARYGWRGRTHKRNVARVRQHHGTRRSKRGERLEVQNHLTECAWRYHRHQDLVEEAAQWMRSRSLEVSPEGPATTYVR